MEHAGRPQLACIGGPASVHVLLLPRLTTSSLQLWSSTSGVKVSISKVDTCYGWSSPLGWELRVQSKWLQFFPLWGETAEGFPALNGSDSEVESQLKCCGPVARHQAVPGCSVKFTSPLYRYLESLAARQRSCRSQPSGGGWRASCLSQLDTSGFYALASAVRLQSPATFGALSCWNPNPPTDPDLSSPAACPVS